MNISPAALLAALQALDPAARIEGRHDGELTHITVFYGATQFNGCVRRGSNAQAQNMAELLLASALRAITACYI